MSKKLLESIMQDSDRQISGIGPGSKEEGSMSMAVGNSKSLSGSDKPVMHPQMPFQIDNVIRDTADALEITMRLHKNFTDALDNGSINKSQKVALKKSIDSLHLINSFLLKELPQYLEMFH